MSTYTPFQCKVFEAVSRIPFGQTRSYKWVAHKIGRPKAARAVGQALKRNSHFFVIPCHRVIKEDGSIGGYALGRGIKKRLLELEKGLV